MAKQFLQSLVTLVVASKKKQIILLSLVGVLGALCAVVATNAQAKQVIMNTIAINSPRGLQAQKDGCNTCVVVPAIVTKNSSSSSSSTSHTHIVVHTSFTANVREFEKVQGAVVGFSMMPNGLPASQQHKCVTDDFDWSGWKTVNGKTVYTRNPNHGMTHACWDGHNWRQIGGGPDQWNCGNVVMKHRPHGTIVPRVIAFHSHADFTSTFDRLVKKQNSSTSTSTSQTSYACPVGFNSVPGDVTHCQNCPPCPTTTVVTTTQPSTTTVHTTTTVPTTTTVVTTTTTPAKNQPVIESITVLNDVRIGDTSPTWCVTVKLDNADSGTIKFAPVYGKFSVMSQYGGAVNSDGSVVFNVTGGEHTYCATYNPPTEVPPGGKDDVVVTLATGVNTVQGTPSSSPPSPWFRIDPKPVNP
jgi:hypothetical protein